MSQTTITPISVPSFPPLTYKNMPVLTSGMLAQAYEVEPKQIRQNFANNKERFVEGKHYYSITGEELKSFRLCVENFDSQISSKTRFLTLWTERGAARHAKMLNSDRAWDVFELLEETFFAVAKPAQTVSYPDLPLTPDQQCTIQALVKAKVDAVPAKLRHNGLYPQIYKRFNSHFRIGSYKQLLQSMMNEGIAYLVQMEVYTGKEEREEKRELPPSQPQFPSGIVSNIPGPQPGDKYYAYLEKVERWRVATVAERKNLYNEGIALLEVERMGREMFHVCADYLSLWLKNEVLSSPTGVFDDLLRHNRAPVMLAKFLNTNSEDVRKYMK